jgi:hypothetical protein
LLRREEAYGTGLCKSFEQPHQCNTGFDWNGFWKLHGELQTTALPIKTILACW